MFAAIITPNTISFHAKHRPWVVTKGHANYTAVMEKVKEIQKSIADFGTAVMRPIVDRMVDELIDLVDVKTFIAKVTEGRVQIAEGEVRFDGRKITGVIVDRLLQCLQTNTDIRPVARFLDRVSNNPDITARDEIFLFLESGNMPLTDDGCFLAYKYVRDDYYSCHSGRGPGEVRNMVGDTPSMPREEVDKDRNNECSRGLHFCSFQYLDNRSAGSRIVVVKVAPEDVVSIPRDYNNSKGRTWRYVVVDEVLMSPALETRFADTPVTTNEGMYDNRDEAVAASEDMDEEYEGYADEDLEDPFFSEQDEPVPNEVFLPVETVTAETEVVFKITKRRKITGAELKQAVADFGQRGAATKLKVPRTTIQSWLKRANA